MMFKSSAKLRALKRDKSKVSSASNIVARASSNGGDANNYVRTAANSIENAIRCGSTGQIVQGLSNINSNVVSRLNNIQSNLDSLYYRIDDMIDEETNRLADED